MKLRHAIKYLCKKHGCTVETVVGFYKNTARQVGYSGSLAIPKTKGNPSPRSELSDSYLRWRGDIGAGLQLRLLCEAQKEAR